MKKWSVLVAALAIVVLAGPSFAAPKSSASGSLWMDGTAARIAAPTLGSTVVIDAAFSGTRRQDTVRVQLICMQSGSVVYGDAHTLTSSPSSLSFTLGQASTTASSVWTSGGATCRSDLFVLSPGSSEPNFLATLTFDAV